MSRLSITPVAKDELRGSILSFDRGSRSREAGGSNLDVDQELDEKLTAKPGNLITSCSPTLHSRMREDAELTNSTPGR